MMQYPAPNAHRDESPGRLKVLLSAYACLPGWGTEPGVGWHTARVMAQHHDVWLLTYAGFRPAIDRELEARPIPGLRVVGHRLLVEAARHARDGEWRSGLAEQAHYYAWQVSAGRVARRLHARIGFDLAAHATFVKYWAPSAVSGLGIPFVWGPVGGGETAPTSFYRTFSPTGLRYERKRDIARMLFDRDPRVRRTAKRATLAFATTAETRVRMEALGARNVEIRSAIGLPAEEVEMLAGAPPLPDGPARFVAIGRMLAFKGYRFAIEAFARAVRTSDPAMAGAELWILGDGPERPALESLVAELDVGGRIHMPGHVSREDVLRFLTTSHALVHPSLHESGGVVCLEAMAAGRPVICFDLGGSAVHVDANAGVRVPAKDPRSAVDAMAAAIRSVASDRDTARAMGAAGREHVRRSFIWEHRVADLAERYRRIARHEIARGDGAMTPAELAEVTA
jgi:glycosyltransferase involved in cell wall biosynthesis